MLVLAALFAGTGLQVGAKDRAAGAMASYQLMRLSVLGGLRSSMYGPVLRQEPLEVAVRVDGVEGPGGDRWLRTAVARDRAFERGASDPRASVIGRRDGRAGQVFVHLILRRESGSSGESWDLATPTAIGTLAWPALAILGIVAGALVGLRRRGEWGAPLVVGLGSQAAFWFGASVTSSASVSGGSAFSSMEGVGIQMVVGRLVSAGGSWWLIALALVSGVGLALYSRRPDARSEAGGARVLGLALCWGVGSVAWADVAARTGAFALDVGVLGAMAWLCAILGVGLTLRMGAARGDGG